MAVIVSEEGYFVFFVKRIRDRIRYTSFSSQLTNEHNKLECYVTLSFVMLIIEKLSSLHNPFISYEESEMLLICTLGRYSHIFLQIFLKYKYYPKML